MNIKEIYVLGVGGSTPVFMDIAEACGYKIAGLYHYNNERTGEMEHGYQILGSFDDLYNSDIKGKCFLLSQGNMKIRQSVTQRITKLGGMIPTLIHPTANVSKFAKVSSEGVVIGSYCVVQADAVINNGVQLWDMALVCHQTAVGEYVFIGPKALVGAHIVLKDFSFVGQGAVLVSGKVGMVGISSLVGAGAVVTKSVPNEVVVAGNPARFLPPPYRLINRPLSCSSCDVKLKAA